jgi:hypothetical protein
MIKGLEWLIIIHIVTLQWLKEQNCFKSISLDANAKIYQQMMDCLIYFIDAMFDVGYHARGLINQFMVHPQKTHFEFMKHIFR